LVRIPDKQDDGGTFPRVLDGGRNRHGPDEERAASAARQGNGAGHPRAKAAGGVREKRLEFFHHLRTDSGEEAATGEAQAIRHGE
jgi:hypothetical protein